MEYLLDFILCGLVTMGELIGVIILMLLTQLFFYRVLKINLYKLINKKLYQLEKYVEEVF